MMRADSLAMATRPPPTMTGAQASAGRGQRASAANRAARQSEPNKRFMAVSGIAWMVMRRDMRRRGWAHNKKGAASFPGGERRDVSPPVETLTSEASPPADLRRAARLPNLLPHRAKRLRLAGLPAGFDLVTLR